MARGGVSPVPVTLPVVSFSKVEDDFSSKHLSIPEQSIRAYGYNDGSSFQRPEHYTRYIEPLESELAVQVEYDMDEQDQCWLDALNIERRAKNLGSVPYEVFEIVMDRLEKEWFDLTKNIPKPDLAMPSEDSTCAICDDSEGENTNAIVFCDGCNLAVHQDCYGVPYIPEGQWLCRKCTVSPENPVSCALCPNEGGAFKQAISGEWVHLLCAIWVPETRVGNDVFMEPVTGLDKISKQRWKLKCSICDVREGACIQCTKSSCFLAFHATCARKEKLLMPMKSSQGSEAPTLACYCEKHLPREQAEARATALAAERSEGVTHNDNDPQAVKSARAYAKTYKPGLPLVPQIIVRRIEQYIQRLQLRHRHEFIILACKYWSLKREARRGAPLLKRLHLEPWTASVGGRNQSDEDKVIKLEHAKRVRQDLETLKTFVVACRRREGRKLQQQTAIQNILSQFILKKQPLLRMAFEDIMAQDKSLYFKDPVSKVDVPDYYDIIKNPICWSTIDKKLDQYEYWDLESLKADIRLVLSNAMIYNKADTPYWRTAQRIKNSSETIFAKLDKRINPHDTLPPTDSEPQEASSSMPSEELPPPTTTSAIGDIEPPLELLELLLAQETMENERGMKYMLEKTPIEALFSFELGKLKPAPAPPSPPSPPSPSPPPPPLAATTATKPKRDRKAEKERRRRHAQIDTSPGFRPTAPPRTRRALAAFAAFEAEASGPPEHERGQIEGESLDSAAPVAEVTMDVDVDGDGDAHVAEPEAESKPEPVPETDPVPEQEPEHEQESIHEQEPVPEQEPEPEDAPVVVPSKRKHKRSPITLPGQSEVPPVVDSVDNQQSFKMFDAGWILPDDYRRGGRAPVERQPLPEPKKKKSRTEREKSHLSIATTSPVHSDTLLPLNASAGTMEPGTSFSPQAPLGEISAEPMVVDEGHAQVQGQEEVLIMASPVQLPVEEHSMESPDAEPPIASATPGDEPVLLDGTPVPVPESAPEFDTTAEVDPDSHPEPAQTAGEDTEAARAEEEEEEEEEDDGPPRIIIIEELDTPATRREKNMRKKAERQRLAAEAAAAAAALREAEAQALKAVPDAAHENGGDGEDKEMDVGEDAEMASQSDLTSLGSTNGEAEDARMDMDMDATGVLSGSLTPVEGLLSEADDDGDGDVKMSGRPPRESPSITPLPPSESPLPSPSDLPTMSPLPSPSEPPSLSPITPSAKLRAKTKKQRLKEEMERGKLRLARGKFLEGGTLVWAKLPTYPWWPAVVFEPDHPTVTKEGVQLRPNALIKKDQLHLVRFYDNKNYWDWLTPDKIMLLGEDEDLDAEMVSSSSTIQKWKNSRTKDALRKAYRRALGEMETGDAGEADASNA